MGGFIFLKPESSNSFQVWETKILWVNISMSWCRLISKASEIGPCLPTCVIVFGQKKTKSCKGRSPAKGKNGQIKDKLNDEVRTMEKYVTLSVLAKSITEISYILRFAQDDKKKRLPRFARNDSNWVISFAWIVLRKFYYFEYFFPFSQEK